MLRLIDILIISFFIIFSIILIFKPIINPSNKNIKKLLLIVENDRFYIPYKDGNFNLVNKISDINGNTHTTYKEMEFEIVHGKVRVLHSNCANKICVNTSWIEKCGESIICVPNRVAVIIDCNNRNSN